MTTGRCGTTAAVGRSVLAKVASAATFGIEAFPIDVEVDFAGGLPAYHLVGLPAAAVQEGRFRIRTALTNSGFPLRAARVTVNLAPADVRKNGAAFDLPIAVGTLAASGALPPESLERRLFVGELSLDGALKPVRGALPIASLAARRGIRDLVVPEVNAAEAALVDAASVRGAPNLSQVVAFLRGETELARPSPEDDVGGGRLVGSGLDFQDVRGHELAIRALEIAAAGSHNVLLVGPPGSGKTMLAQRVPTILPPLTRTEALECTTIYSVAGLLGSHALVEMRPFRAPHHTITQAGLTGGGTDVRPGEVSLAHHGVLFLDELPEFSRACLESLRQPLEDKRLTIARARRVVTYPAAFMLLAAMNPCPCGHSGDAQRSCTCSRERVARYRGRISGPVLDRFDMHLWIGVAPYRALLSAPAGEPSVAIAGRVTLARQRQRHRFRDQPRVHANAQMTPQLLRRYAPLDEECHDLLAAHSAQTGISTRGIERLIRVARTVADLRAVDRVEADDIIAAIGCRYLDVPVPADVSGDYGGREDVAHPAT